MQEYQNVISTTKPDAVTVDEYSVWTHTDIRSGNDGYVSTMRQYTKDEYIKLIDEKNVTLEEQLTDTQLALCDVYEMIGG